jgi:hypothetical protein
MEINEAVTIVHNNSMAITVNVRMRLKPERCLLFLSMGPVEEQLG